MGHKDLYRRFEDLGGFVLEDLGEVLGDFLDDRFLVVTGDVDETRVGLEQHLRVEQLLLFRGLVNMRALLREQLLFVHVGPEVLNELGLDLLVLDIQRIAHIIELPPLLNLEILGQLFPVVVDALNQLKIGLHNRRHLTQIKRVLLHILPKNEIPLQELTNLPLDLLKLDFRVDDVLDVKLAQIELVVQFLVLFAHRFLYTLEL